MTGTPIDVSIIVVSYNTREVTLECVRSVLAHGGCPGTEIIVVDNASSDGSADALAGAFPEIQIIRNDTNLGFAAANNQGIRRASGRYLLLLNSDVMVHDGAIEATVRFADQKPRAAVVGCRTLNGDGSLQRTCYLPPSLLNLSINLLWLHRLLPQSHIFGRERMTYWDHGDERRVPVVAGCFMLVRRNAIDEVGLLDERFFMFAEEVDWCVRFVRAGWDVWYTPAGTITHFGGLSTSEIGIRKRLVIERSVVKFLRKYHRRPYVVVYVALLGLLALSRSPIQLGASLVRLRRSP